MVEFINVGLGEESVAGGSWASGLLAPGSGYKVKLDEEGSFRFAAGETSTGVTVVVEEEPVSTGEPGDAPALFLPLVTR